MLDELLPECVTVHHVPGGWMVTLWEDVKVVVDGREETIWDGRAFLSTSVDTVIDRVRQHMNHILERHVVRDESALGRG